MVKALKTMMRSRKEFMMKEVKALMREFELDGSIMRGYKAMKDLMREFEVEIVITMKLDMREFEMEVFEVIVMEFEDTGWPVMGEFIDKINGLLVMSYTDPDALADDMASGSRFGDARFPLSFWEPEGPAGDACEVVFEDIENDEDVPEASRVKEPSAAVPAASRLK